MKIRSWGIKERAIFLALVPALVIAVALTGYFVVLRYADVEAALISRGLALVRQLAPAAEYGAFSGNRSELTRLALATVREPDVSAVAIYDDSGRLLASAGKPSVQADVAWLPDEGHRLGGDGSLEIFYAKIQRPLLAFDDPFLTSEAPQIQGDRVLGGVVLELSRANVEARKQEILAVTLLATLFVLAIASLLARRLALDITEPVLALEDTVARLHAGQFDARAPHHPSGTLRSLETGFNEMADTLAESHRQSASALAESEAELAKQLNFAQTLLNAQSDAGVGLMIIEHGRIVFANRAIEETFGYAADEICSLPTFLTIVHPDDRLRVIHNHMRRMQGERFDNHYDVAIQRKDGSYGHADLTVATLPGTEGVLGVLCIIVDITERKQAETRLAEAHRELLIKKEEAERASEGKSRFLAAASHDLRQPLHALTLFATELAAVVIRPRERKLSQQIVTAAGAVSELLDTLLEVSRLDISALQPNRRSVALSPLIESIIDGYEQTALNRGLRLVYRPTELWAITDPQLLRRMISNLVANAVRYTKRGGILIGVRKRAGLLRIEIWDTGIGIDDAHLPHLFQEFYQVDNPERDSSKGLGLGLSIVERLGQILDHPVSVMSRKNRGSVFAITLPPGDPAAFGNQPNRPRGARIAVRTQEMGVCQKICSLIDAWGYEHVCAHESDTPQLLAAHPKVIICDAKLLPDITEQLPPDDPPLLVALDSGATRGDLGPAASLVSGRLSSPPQPARLRALLHHLLIESNAEAVDSAPIATL